MQTTTPEDVGLSSIRLDRINSFMEDLVKDNRLPGVLTLVQRHGKVAHFGKFGSMDIAAGKPMQEDALFRIYSMTKPITSVAIMLLLEEGRLNLFDPVSNFISAFANTKVCVGSSTMGLDLVDQQPVMTIHHLLTHTSGLSYGSFYDSPAEEFYRRSDNQLQRETSLKDLVEKVASFPLVFQLGTRWRYSMSVDVLGYIVEVISGMSLGDFFKERIFKPLGMVDTDFCVPPEKVNRLAQIYSSDALYDIRPVPPAYIPGIRDITKPTLSPLGGAGLVSTLGDYLAFSNCMLNKGAYAGGRLLSRKTVEWMTANHIPASLMPIKMGLDERDHGFGLGFRVTTHLGQARRLSSVGEFGWGGLANTYFWVDPAEDFIGLMMTQHLPKLPYTANDIFRNLAYQAITD
ncbi:MAG: beta-lactamase family protein [Anaerolineae bacterium]|nr:beta-lactamase family protein [Anaerolineae bacterium]